MYKTYVKVNKLKIPTLPDVTFSFTMDKGEIICITGDNGSGKTSLGMYLAGLLRPQGLGQVIIDGLDPFSELDRDKLRRRAGYVFQDPRDGIAFENLLRDIMFGMENQGLPSEKVTKRAAFYLKKYGLYDKRNRSIYSLSASEQQRAALAAVQVMRQDFLVLDEPFSLQDDDTAKAMMKILIENAKKRNQTVIIFSVDKRIMEMCERTFKITDGVIREADLETEVLGEPSEPRSYGTIQSGFSKLQIEKKFQGKHRPLRSIGLHNIYYGFDKDQLFTNFSFNFEAGAVYKISGPPSSGKTALMEIIGGIRKNFAGDVEETEGTRISYVFQHPSDCFVEARVLDDVMFGPLSDGKNKQTARDMACKVLEFVGLSRNLWSRSPLSLSLGEQRLLGLAGALALDPDFLLLDDPYRCLDYSDAEHIRQIVEALCNEGKCIIYT